MNKFLTLLAFAMATQAFAQEQKAVVAGNNEFAFDLYSRLAKEPGNTFFSPYSISTALAMTSAGAKGETLDQMAKTLHLPENSNQTATGFQSLIQTIQGAGQKRAYQLSTANALWANQGFTLAPKFLATTQTNYHAGLYLVDFVNATEASRKKINGWVEDKTNNKIQDLLPQGVLTADTRLVLTNAIYFKGDWLVPFIKESTRAAEFRTPGKGSFQVPTMYHQKTHAYAADDSVQLVSLPYKGNELSMVIVLPRKDNGLADLEKKLTAKYVEGLLAQTKQTKVDLYLPKIKMTQSISLSNTLQDMGMTLAFSKQANFSGIAEDSTIPLKIDAVIHKAFVEVDEKGTEAAAATGVAIGTFSSAIDPTKPELFKADHPFAFLIRHNATGSVLFLGRVVDPRGK